MSKYLKMLADYKSSNLIIDDKKLWCALEIVSNLVEEVEMKDPVKFMDTAKDLHELFKGEHFDEMYAILEVNKMFHTTSDGKKMIGEKFSMLKAQEVHSRHKSMIHPAHTVYDVYVAINSHFHNYHSLYCTWFREDDIIIIEEKIVESAMAHWFKDEDCECVGKIWRSFSK